MKICCPPCAVYFHEGAGVPRGPASRPASPRVAGQSKEYRRARRLVAACCLGCWYTMLCWTPAGAEAPKGAPEAPGAEGMDRV